MKRIALCGFLLGGSFHLAASRGAEPRSELAALPVWEGALDERLEDGGFSTAFVPKGEPKVVVKLYNEAQRAAFSAELVAYRRMLELQLAEESEEAGDRDFVMAVIGFFQSPRQNLIIKVERLGRDLTSMQAKTDCDYGLAEATIIAQQLARAARYFEKHKLAHNDVKPDNVMFLEGLGDRVAVKLGDFGLATGFDEVWRGGTPGFVPPEYRNAESGQSLAGKAITKPGGDVYSTVVTWVDLFRPNVFVDLDDGARSKFQHTHGWVGALVNRATASVSERTSPSDLADEFTEALAESEVTKDDRSLAVATVLGEIKVWVNPGLTLAELKDRIMLATWRTHGTRALRASHMRLLWTQAGESEGTFISTWADHQTLDTLGILAPGQLSIEGRRDRIRR